jgi:hypothetical protein
LLSTISASRKKREYEDKDETEEVDEATESGDDERDLSEAAELEWLSGGNRTAIVPPTVGLLDSPHMFSRSNRYENGYENG